MIHETQFKYCPRCASTAIAVHQKNGIECSACGFIYFHNIASGVAAIIEIQNKILLLKRASDPFKGMLDFPGGFVDRHESLDAALVREVREELNLELADIRYFGSSHNEYEYKGVTYFAADAFFVCRPKDIGTLSLSDENEAYLLVDAHTVNNADIAFKPMLAMLEKYRKHCSLRSLLQT
jgi:NAD+ diphosphatase